MHLAVKLYKTPEYKGIVDCSTKASKDKWLNAFGLERNTTQLLLKCCPLKCDDLRYSFLHKSLLEYFVARAIIKATMKPQDARDEGQKEAISLFTERKLVDDPVAQFLVEYAQQTKQAFALKLWLPALIDQAKADSTHKKTVQKEERFCTRINAIAAEKIMDKNIKKIRDLLDENNMVNDSQMVPDFVEEYIQLAEASMFKHQLWAFIKHSKKEETSKVAAANAITILVKAGEKFSGADLCNIQIPGANISYGVFDKVQLQKADLSDVKLVGTSLRAADMTEANLHNVQFGEKPELHFKDSVTACCYSLSGQLAIAENC
ncbi:MAG TPA: pentapeptide repeat-containing protein, partial [Chlamydiales bacterium]|nr:pentapeptide repeat-containing protein [Chlamydiales bacterium]